MGVITTAYSVSAEMMKKIKSDKENLKLIFGEWEEQSPHPEDKIYDFDERGFEIAYILRSSGYEKGAATLDVDANDYFDYEGYNVWIATPTQLKAISKELAKATYEDLKTIGLANETKNYDNDVIPEYEYESYVGEIDDIKKFFKDAADQGNSLIFALA